VSRLGVSLALSLAASACSLGPEPGGEEAPRTAWDVRGDPQWIWADVRVEDGQRAWFRRSFDLAGTPWRAGVWASADNHFEAWLNGERVAAGDEWTRPVRADVSRAIRTGRNDLAVLARNDGGPAALAFVLEADLDGGETFRLATGGDWRATAREPGSDWVRGDPDWDLARSFGALDTAPWGPIALTVDRGGEAPPASAIEVPPGFRVERLHSVAPDSQGSWISLAVDPRGRLYASDQYGGLFRIDPPPIGSDREARVEALDVRLGEAHGLLWAFDALYAVVSGAGRHRSGLYRARDTDGDDRLDEVSLLEPFEGSGEHGPHAVLLHPDGRSLVVVAGNHCLPPASIERFRLPPRWGEDVLLPPLPDPNGHAVGIRAPGGWIARTDPDGERWELIAGGLRNPYDAAFSREGELFTYEADMEWDVGLPWYRPTRILHVTSGAEFGWRSGSAKWPADSFDSLPAVLDLDLGSPTGVVFGDAARFAAPWNRALFAADWAYGRIFAVILDPDGASFGGRSEVFAAGRPFPVTDLVVGADGALYVTTGGRRAQSGLYRISGEGPSPIPALEPVLDPAAEAARARRRAMEEFHGVRSREIAPFLLAGLGDPDRFVRYAARIALEHQDPDLWVEPAIAERDPRAALEGLLAAIRAGAAADAGAVMRRAVAIFEESGEEDLRRDALRVVELAMIRLAPSPASRDRLRERLGPSYPSGSERLDRALLPILVDLEAPRIAERALDRLETAESQEERVAVAYALRALRSTWTEETSRRFLGLLDRELGRVRGGESAAGYLEKIREEACLAMGVEPTRRPEAIAAEVASGPLGEGERAYRRAGCNECHRFEGKGEDRGPDLTGVVSRFTRRDLLVAIEDPSREVPDVWRDTEFWGGNDDLLAVGRLEEERLDSLVVRTLADERRILPLDRVVERRPHPLSRMPDGLLDALSAKEIDDLLAFLLEKRGQATFSEK